MSEAVPRRGVLVAVAPTRRPSAVQRGRRHRLCVRGLSQGLRCVRGGRRRAGCRTFVDVAIVGCPRTLFAAPLAILADGRDLCTTSHSWDAFRVVVEHSLEGGRGTLYVDPKSGVRVACWHDIPFYREQTRLRCGTFGSQSIRSASRSTCLPGGYAAARTALREKDAGVGGWRRCSPRACADARRRLSHRAQMEVRGGVTGPREVCGLQRRRRRPRRVHGRLNHGRRSSRRH